MLNKTMLIWALPRNWVTWFLCSVNLKTMRWPTATCTFCWLGTGTLSVFVTVSQDVVCSWLLSLPLATKGWKWVICTLFHTHLLCSALSKGTSFSFVFLLFFLHPVGVNRKQMNPDTLYPCQMFSGLLQIMLKNAPQQGGWLLRGDAQI